MSRAWSGPSASSTGRGPGGSATTSTPASRSSSTSCSTSTRRVQWSRWSGWRPRWRRSCPRPIPREFEMAATDVDIEQEVRLPVDGVTLVGDLARPAAARGAVLFAHGSGSSRHSPRNRAVARVLRSSGLATLLIDLLTRDEQAEDAATRHLRFDIALLARRLVAVAVLLHAGPVTAGLPAGYFGGFPSGGAAPVGYASRCPGLAVGAPGD